MKGGDRVGEVIDIKAKRRGERRHIRLNLEKLKGLLGITSDDFTTAEQWILGAILLGIIKTECVAYEFKQHDHALIFISMQQLATAGRPIDLITVTEQLNNNKWLDKVGGTVYLAMLADGTKERG